MYIFLIYKHLRIQKSNSSTLLAHQYTWIFGKVSASRRISYFIELTSINTSTFPFSLITQNQSFGTSFLIFWWAVMNKKEIKTGGGGETLRSVRITISSYSSSLNRTMETSNNNIPNKTDFNFRQKNSMKLNNI